MTLTTHAITGATLATLAPNHPILGFVLGFTSHFVLDAIPHWDYSLKSMKNGGKGPLDNDMIMGQDFLRDLIKIGIDGTLGILFSFILLNIFHQHSPLTIFLGVVGGMIPDALQFFYFKWKHEPLISLQRFHIWIHPKTGLHDKPILGIFFQILIIFTILTFFFILKR